MTTRETAAERRARNWEDTDANDVAEVAKKIEAARKYDSSTSERRNYWGELAIWSERRLGTLLIEAKSDGVITKAHKGNGNRRDTLSRLLGTENDEQARAISSRAQQHAGQVRIAGFGRAD